MIDKKQHLDGKVNLKDLFYGLLFSPRIIIILQRRKWLHPLFLVAILSVISSLILIVPRIPSYLRSTNEWSDWLKEEVGDIRLENKRILWDTPTKLPYKTSFKNMKIQFMPHDSKFIPKDINPPENRGIWIKDTQIYYWTKLSHNSTAKYIITVLETNAKNNLRIEDDDNIWSFFKIINNLPKTFRIKAKDYKVRLNQLCKITIPALLILKSISTFFQVFFYVLFFTVFQHYFKEPLMRLRSFGESLSFYLYASIPSVIIAAIYTSANFPFLEYSSIFLISYFIYLMYLTRDTKKIFTEKT